MRLKKTSPVDKSPWQTPASVRRCKNSSRLMPANSGDRGFVFRRELSHHEPRTIAHFGAQGSAASRPAFVRMLNPPVQCRGATRVRTLSDGKA